MGRTGVMGSRPKIMAVTYGGGHAAAVAPVLAQLQADATVVALGLTTAGPSYARHGVPYRGLADYPRPDDARVQALGAQLLADVAGTSSAVSAEESRAYLGSCMADLIDALGEGPAWALYRERGRHAFDPEATLRRIVWREQPDLIVTTNSPKSERASIRAARALGIESLMIPDMFCHPSWEMYVPFEADHFAVIASLAVKNLETFHHVDPTRVTVTGQPAFDKQHVPDRASALDYVRGQVGAAVDAGYLLVTTSPDVPDATYPAQGSRDAELAVRALLARHDPSSRLVIKPHPSEPRAMWDDLVAGHPGVVVAPAGSDINQFLRAADALIAGAPTTAVIDALSLDVPTVVCCVGRPALRNVLPWSDLAVPVVTEAAAVTPLAARETCLAAVPTTQAAVRAEFHRSNTGATGRVAALVHERALAARQGRA
jgi:hypothetical protein